MNMTSRGLTFAVLFALCGLSAGWAYYREAAVGEAMTAAAEKFVQGLDAGQRSQAVMPYDDARRVDWHFIPKDARKGLLIKEMTEPQRKAAHALLQSALSQTGYAKAATIMTLEKLLFALEGEKRRWPRDWELYYFTLFGDPAGKEKWGLSVEGHHLSLNFVVENGRVVSTTPQVMASNPAIVKHENTAGFAVGTRVLAQEELLGFELAKSLTAEQRGTAIIADKAPAEVRAAGEPQPPQEAPVGIAASELTEAQQATLRRLIDEYAQAMPPAVARQRWDEIEAAGFGAVRFAWAGATEPGIGHYYRIQGATFVIEFVNTQPDAAGNPANHIHCLWRDMRGDFALPAK